MFKDRLSTVIDEWKRSDRVQYSKGGNPRPPSVEEVVAWVSSSWKPVSSDVVRRPIAAAGFAVDYATGTLPSMTCKADSFRASGWELTKMRPMIQRVLIM